MEATIVGDVTQWTGEEKLHDLLNHHYGLVLLKAKPVGGILKIKTDQGSFALKRVRRGEKERWKMLRELQKHVREQGMTISLLQETNSGAPYFNGFRHSYAVIPWVKGNVLELQCKEDWGKATTVLANMHQASKDFQPSASYRGLAHTGKWKNQWEKEIQLSEVFHLAAKWTTTPTEADRFWLQTASYTTSVMENLMEYYAKIEGDKICTETAQYGKICHANLHRSNLLQDQSGNVHILDWNEAVLNVRTHDIASWLLYAYGKTGSKEVLKTILSSYQSVSPLTEEEYPLIYARLLYPERLMHTLEAVYEREQQDTNEGIAASTIQHLTQIEEKKAPLLGMIAALIKEEYQVTIPVLDWLHN